MAVKEANAIMAMEALADGKIIQASLCQLSGAWLALVATGNGLKLACAYRGKCVPAEMFVSVRQAENTDGTLVLLMDLNANNAAVVRRFVKWSAPCAQGAKGVSMAFTDRLGLAAPILAEAFKLRRARPVLVDYSLADSAALGKNFLEAVDEATWGVLEVGYKNGYGANAVGLKTEEDIVKALLYGYSMIGFDCTEKIDLEIEQLSDEEVAKRFNSFPEEFRYALTESYLKAEFKAGDYIVSFTESELQRMVLEYGEAIMHIQFLYTSYLKNTPWDIDFELNLTKNDKLMTAQEQYFLSNELQRNGIKFAALVVDGHKMAESTDMLSKFGAIADVFGYRLSILNADSSFADLSVINKALNGKAYLKLGSALWLAAMQVVAEKNSELFASIRAYKNLPEASIAELLPALETAQVWSSVEIDILTAKEQNFAEAIKTVLGANKEAYAAAINKLLAGVFAAI